MRRTLVAAVAAASLLVPLAPGVEAGTPGSLTFDEGQATARNGTIPSGDPTAVCGNTTKRFLEELLGGNPLDYTVPYRLGDVGAQAPDQMLLSGTVEDSVLGAGDFPFDHPFGSDFNADVRLDPAFQALRQLDGVVQPDQPMHIELEAGLFPHTLAVGPGPAEGMDWETMSEYSRANLLPGFVPQKGDRIVVMGRFINDCGHLPFQTEIHPISFMAWSHTVGNKTWVGFFHNPYREMQLYTPDPSLVDQVNDPGRQAQSVRADAPVTFSELAYPFPKGLVVAVLQLLGGGPAGFETSDRLESRVLMEANHTSPADWEVCAPASATGRYTNVDFDVWARPGADVRVVGYDHTTGCATMRTALGTQTTPEPTSRLCTTPWDFLNEVSTEEAGSSTPIDLKAQIGQFVPDPYKYKLDTDPVTNCYDPLSGPTPEQDPSGMTVHRNGDQKHAFYGVLTVTRSDTPPPPLEQDQVPPPVAAQPAFTG